MSPSTARLRGQLIADFLAGSWRENQKAPDISLSDLEQLAGLLYNSGGTGLAWWRIHESDLRASSCGELLHQGYRLQALQTPINEDRIVRAFRLLRGAGVEPILVKGWATARLYPHRTLRSYGDVDLLVGRTHFAGARELLDRDKSATWWVDLHNGLTELDDRSTDELFKQKQLPEWLVDTVLKQWGNLFQADHLPVRPQRLMAHSLKSPGTILKDICARWPDPIVATFNLRGGPNNFPRLPYQLGAFASQAGRYLIDRAIRRGEQAV